MREPLVGILLGSDSDLPVMKEVEEAAEALKNVLVSDTMRA